MLETILHWDVMVFEFINGQMHFGPFEELFILFRNKYFWMPLYLFLIAFIFMNFRQSKWLIFGLIALTIGTSDTVSSRIIKSSVQRQRPCQQVDNLPAIQLRIPCSTGYSFTSSHATNHFAIAFFLLFLFRRWRFKWVFVVWAGLIAIAQVYVGVHFPVDILCGAIIGALIGSITGKLLIFADHRLFDHQNTEV